MTLYTRLPCTCLSRRHATGVLAALSLLPAWALAQPGPADTSTSARAGLPALGDAGAMTPLQERKLGDAIARELYRDPAYLDDAVLGEYVDGLWRALLAGARARGELPAELAERYAWQVLLGRDASINAFALPGGYFGLHTGLVGAVSTRDELASVLAHEMTHITQRHIPRLLSQQARQTPLLLAAMVLGAIAASKNPQAGSAVMVGGQAALAQQQLNFSRDMEREADRIGYGILTQAGFSPQGFVSMFEKLQNASRINDNGDWPYLRSHPLTTQRIADMQQRQQTLPRQSATPDVPMQLVAARARVLGRPGVDVLRAWASEPAQAGFASLPLPRRAAALYAGALAQAQLRELPRAQALAAQLAALQAAQPTDAGMAHAAALGRLLQAELALQAGDAARALTWLPEGGSPAAAEGQTGRAALLLRAQALMGAGRASEASTALQAWVATHPHDAGAWQSLAQARHAQGQTLRALRAEGEVPMARMDYAGAVDRWRAAQDHSRRHLGDNAERIEASIIDTRLRAAQEALKQQQEDEIKRR
ncbi:MAG: M48 family metalloprotease [Pseudomonadota bacterium]|nr:M48 family metalloprotease [Pseudomonadota bacterium]